MSEIIRNLVSGKPMSRRDFLKKAAGGAILGATKDIPLPSAPPKIAEEAQQIADILKYVQLVRHPHEGIVVEELIDEMPSGQIAAIVSDALYGGQWPQAQQHSRSSRNE